MSTEANEERISCSETHPTADVFHPDGHPVPTYKPTEAEMAFHDEVKRIVGEACGAVSMCWEPTPTGLFDSTSAAAFVAEAVNEIMTLPSKGMSIPEYKHDQRQRQAHQTDRPASMPGLPCMGGRGMSADAPEPSPLCHQSLSELDSVTPAEHEYHKELKSILFEFGRGCGQDRTTEQRDRRVNKAMDEIYGLRGRLFLPAESR